jgi:hypothetical protein
MHISPPAPGLVSPYPARSCSFSRGCFEIYFVIGNNQLMTASTSIIPVHGERSAFPVTC